MPRGLTTPQSTLAAAPRLGVALLIEMDFAPEVVRLWSGLGTFTWGNRVFTGAGTLIGVGEVEEAAEVRAAATALTLSGVPGEVVTHAIAVDWQGRPCTIWLALLDEGMALVGDPVRVLAGRMDTLTWAEGDDAIITISVENRLVDLERPRVRRYTDADQRAEYPGDLAFQYVPSLIEREIKWGS